MPNEPKICPIMSNRNLGNDVTSLWVACQQSKCQLWVEKYSSYLNEKKEHDLIGGHCGLI